MDLPSLLSDSPGFDIPSRRDPPRIQVSSSHGCRELLHVEAVAIERLGCRHHYFNDLMALVSKVLDASMLCMYIETLC